MSTLKEAQKAAIKKASRAWLWVWGFNSLILIGFGLLLPFRWWAIAAFVLFAPFEFIGLRYRNPKYPPLTDVIRVYVPQYACLALIWGLGAAAASKWGVVFTDTISIALFFAAMGWVTVHFLTKYQQAPSD